MKRFAKVSIGPRLFSPATTAVSPRLISPVVLRRSATVICLIALLVSTASVRLTKVRASVEVAQQTASTKHAITHQDYDSWRSIQSPQISRDGKFIAYTFLPQDGDGDVIVRNIATGTDWKAPRGYRPPVPPPDDATTNAGEIIAAQGRLVRPVFTADSKFVVFSIEPTKADVNKAKKEKKKPEEMPKNALGIMDVSNGKVTRIERVKSFQVPDDTAGYIAYLLEPTADERKTDDKGVAREAAVVPTEGQ